MKRKRTWIGSAVVVSVLGALLGGALPAHAYPWDVGSTVNVGTHRFYYNIWRHHTNGYASFTMNSNGPSLAGGALLIGLWDGEGGGLETPMLSFTTNGINQPFKWPGAGYVLPTNTYAMMDGNNGACGGPCGYVITWTGTLTF